MPEAPRGGAGLGLPTHDAQKETIRLLRRWRPAKGSSLLRRSSPCARSFAGSGPTRGRIVAGCSSSSWASPRCLRSRPLEIRLFKVLVDEVLVPRDFGPFPMIALAFAGLSLLGGLIGFVDDYGSTWIGERFVLSLRTSVFRHLQGLSLDFFERRRLGDLLARLTGDVSAIENFVLSGVANAVSYVLRIVFAGALFYLSWELALVSLTVLPLFFLSSRRFSRLIKQASRRSGGAAALSARSPRKAFPTHTSSRRTTRRSSRSSASTERTSRASQPRWPRRG